ncbi:hypothetical protein TNCV_3015541 [Trichonephila clavipes]|nr:hypothetical protein TNCV_3015541 [Trichonephila clavipes]
MPLIKPILEYGFLMFSCELDINLDKLEKIQLSAARIITGNGQAGLLAKDGCNASPPISSTLTYSEHQSRVKSEILKEWRTPRPIITGIKANIQDPHTYFNVAEPLRL